MWHRSAGIDGKGRPFCKDEYVGVVEKCPIFPDSCRITIEGFHVSITNLSNEAFVGPPVEWKHN
jgi:hypothetical protein